MDTSLKQKDPVCGMGVTVAEAKGKVEFEGNVYYFCSPDCRKRFSEDPGLYLEKLELQNAEPVE